MSLAALFNVAHSSDELEHFSVANEAEHNEVGQEIFAKKQIYIPPLLLRPLFPEDQAGWLIRHSTLHTLVNMILKLGSSDLMVLDLQNPARFAEWFWLHAQEHRQWRLTLGI